MEEDLSTDVIADDIVTGALHSTVAINIHTSKNNSNISAPYDQPSSQGCTHRVQHKIFTWGLDKESAVVEKTMLDVSISQYELVITKRAVMSWPHILNSVSGYI